MRGAARCDGIACDIRRRSPRARRAARHRPAAETVNPIRMRRVSLDALPVIRPCPSERAVNPFRQLATINEAFLMRPSSVLKVEHFFNVAPLLINNRYSPASRSAGGCKTGRTPASSGACSLGGARATGRKPALSGRLPNRLADGAFCRPRRCRAPRVGYLRSARSASRKSLGLDRCATQSAARPAIRKGFRRGSAAEETRRIRAAGAWRERGRLVA
jgi:hypothetical protein